MWRRILWGVLGVGLLFVALVAYLGIRFAYESRERVLRTTLPELRNTWGLGFPEGTVLMGSYRERGLLPDGSILAKVDLPRGKVDEFIRSIPDLDRNSAGKSKQTSKKDRNSIRNAIWEYSFSKNPRESWWDPDSARQFISVGWGFSPQMGMLVSLDDPVRAEVYVHVTIW